MTTPDRSDPRSPQPQPVPPAGPDPRPRSRRRAAVIGAAALALLVAVAVIIVTGLRSGPGDGVIDRPGADEDGPDSADGVDAVDLGSAALGDLVAVGGESHDEAVEDMVVAELGDGTPVAVTGADDGARIWDVRTGELTGVHEEDYGGSGVELDVLTVEGRTMVYSRDWSNWTQALWPVDDPAQRVDTSGGHDIEIKWVGPWDGDVPVYIDEFGSVTELTTGEELEYVSHPYFTFWTVVEIGGERRGVGIPDTDGVYVTEDRIVVSDLESGESIGEDFEPITDKVADDITAFTTGRIGDLTLAVTAVRALDAGTVQVWNLETAEQYAAMTHAADLDVQGAELALIDDRPVVLVWGAQGLNLFDVESGQQIGETFAAPEDGEVTAASVTEADGHPVAVTGTSEGRVAVWSLGS